MCSFHVSVFVRWVSECYFAAIVAALVGLVTGTEEK